MNHKVFVLQRRHTGTYFSINHGRDSIKPCVMAFTEKNLAKSFLNTIIQFQDKRRPHQKIIIEEVPSKFLFDTCACSGLNILVHAEKNYVAHIKPQAEIDDIIFHFENKFLYDT